MVYVGLCRDSVKVFFVTIVYPPRSSHVGCALHRPRPGCALEPKRMVLLLCEACSELVPIALLLALSLGGLDANLLVVFLEGGQVFPRLAKFSLLHTLTYVPMHEGALRVHEVELMIDPREDFRNGRRVRDHAAGSHDLREVASRDPH